MKNILIVGWYGTETIGDRAILGSLFLHLSKLQVEFSITIASIYPFYTRRTLFEDVPFFTSQFDCSRLHLNNINVVDSRSVHQLKRAIINNDVVVIGGGPFDDSAEMHMLEYIFLYAKKKGKGTITYGCGLNYLKTVEYKRTAKSIIRNSDGIILRDNNSLNIYQSFDTDCRRKIDVAIDPAVFLLVNYLNINKNTQNRNGKYIAVNLRKFPDIYRFNDSQNNNIDEIAFEKLDELLKDNACVQLVPMNYFAAGNDDRDILNEYKLKSPRRNIFVHNKPLTLEQTIEVYKFADYCIGTRFHSVVFQTILNGNNYILNYTAPKVGKIPGFIHQIEGEQFYLQTRYIDLQNQDGEIIIDNRRFLPDFALISWYDECYMDMLRNVITS